MRTAFLTCCETWVNPASAINARPATKTIALTLENIALYPFPLSYCL